MKAKTHQYLTRQFMLTSDYEIFRYATNDLSGVSLHHHDFYECYLFLSGDVTYLIEGKTYHLEPGDIVLVNSKELHQAIINPTESTYERIVLWINRTFLEELSTPETNLSLCFESPNRKNVLRIEFELQQTIRLLLNKLINLERYNGVGRTLLYKAYITELMVYLNNLNVNDRVRLDVDTKKNNLIDEIIEYVNNHIDDDITVIELSEHFFLSKFHLSREFKKYTGTTIHRYIVQKKLIEAKELILKGAPITDVYEQCGFGDYSNFFRAFKNEYGFTPKQFYEAMKNH
jgi:AraC-like DNA-binding protein/mannose-6-phosphate isomerase-like protein (cupin superfamily)